MLEGHSIPAVRCDGQKLFSRFRMVDWQISDRPSTAIESCMPKHHALTEHMSDIGSRWHFSSANEAAQHRAGQLCCIGPCPTVHCKLVQHGSNSAIQATPHQHGTPHRQSSGWRVT